MGYTKGENGNFNKNELHPRERQVLWSSELQQQGIVKFVSNYEESNIELHVNL